MRLQDVNRLCVKHHRRCRTTTDFWRNSSSLLMHENERSAQSRRSQTLSDKNMTTKYIDMYSSEIRARQTSSTRYFGAQVRDHFDQAIGRAEFTSERRLFVKHAKDNGWYLSGVSSEVHARLHPSLLVTSKDFVSRTFCVPPMFSLFGEACRSRSIFKYKAISYCFLKEIKRGF